MTRNTARNIVTTLASVVGFTALALVAGCASGTGGAQPTTVQPVITGRSQAVLWPIKTREHVDLWLHGFALLSADSSRVPLFRPGYRDELTVLKNKANVLTQLDVNHDRLASQLASNSVLVNAQFVPFYFSSLEEMHAAIDRFVMSDGNPGAARTQIEAAQFAVLASYFRTGPDRTWLALFSSSLWDEDTKFFHSYYVQQQRERANVIDSTTALWQNLMRPRLTKFLANTQQRDGDILLSLPLDGEGRTLSGSGNLRTSIAVTFPQRPANVQQAMYVVAHELVGTITNSAIADNTSPADQRSGIADRYASAASVRGGLILLEKFVPELADGYARYYVSATGATPTASPRTQLASRFPLPDAILAAITRQIDMVDSGI